LIESATREAPSHPETRHPIDTTMRKHDAPAYRRLLDIQSPSSIRSRIRRKRIRPLLEMIAAVHAENNTVNIVDLGGTKSYWKILPTPILEGCNVNITIVNLTHGIASQPEPHFKFLYADACNLDNITDSVFDIVHSNSVIEHVGSWERMEAFAQQVRRLAPRYFIQTPNFWFPIEPHCMTPVFHWLPLPLRVSIIMQRRLGHWPKAPSEREAVRIVQSARLLDRRLFRALFPDGSIRTERFMFLPKSFIAIRE
jgi:hypothetical protein